MAPLSSGNLLKLIEEMGINEKASNDCRPVLLQIRSIIPMLSEGNLWPNQGFYLKVSDSSHAIYVSLPNDQNEMILSNKLHIGQYIYVQNLEAAYPVPIIRGLKPLPGRHPCVGTPQDLFTADNYFVRCIGLSDLQPKFEKIDRGEKKALPKFRSSSASRTRPSGQTGRGFNNMYGKCEAERKNSDRSSFVEKSWNSSSLEFSSCSIAMRRSWNGVEVRRIEESSDASVVKPIARRRSACVSPIHSVSSESVEENPSSKRRSKHISSGMKSTTIPNSNRISVSGKFCKEKSKPVENKILWDSLPPTLVKLGKDALRQRDVAMLTAVEALQEGSAAEKVIKCLSTYSNFRSAKSADLQPSIDKFLALQDDLAHTRLVMQSLTEISDISPLKSTDNDSKITSTGSIKEVLEIAFDRNKHAMSWIRTAMASDLSPVPTLLEYEPVLTSSEVTSTVKKSSKSSIGSTKPKGPRIIRKQRKNDEIQVGLGGTQQDNASLDWVKGSSVGAAADLANSLQNENKRWFLAHVEQYLDGVKSRTIAMQSNMQIAGMMCQFKRANDCLDMIASEDTKSSKMESQESFMLDESEKEACGRVRSKIYGVLLNHVERSAMALENMHANAQEDEDLDM